MIEELFNILTELYKDLHCSLGNHDWVEKIDDSEFYKTPWWKCLAGNDCCIKNTYTHICRHCGKEK